MESTMKKVRAVLAIGALLFLSFATPAYAYQDPTDGEAAYGIGCGIAWFFGIAACGEFLPASKLTRGYP